MPDLENSTPGSGPVATAEPPTTTQGTVPTGSDAGQGAPTEEGFTHVDPRTLPPQLRATYDNMLRDYKEKTTRLSETIKSETEKATQAYREKADFYDQFSSREDAVKWWNEYVQRVKNQETTQEGDPVLSQMKQQLQEMNEKIQISELSQVTEAFAEAADEKGTKLHPEFDNLNNIAIGQLNNGKEAEDFSLLRACVELSPGKTPQEKLANGYKTAKQTYDAIFDAGKKAGMGRLQTKVLNGTNPPSNSMADVLSVTDKKPKNAREALEMARKGQMVSRE